MSDQTLLVIALFFMVALLAYAFATPVAGADSRMRRRLRSRIKSLSREVVENQQISLIRKNYLQRMSPAARWLETRPVFDPLVHMLMQAGLDLAAVHFVGISLALGVAAFGVTMVLGYGLAIAGTAAAVGVIAPYLWLQRKKAQRLEKFEESLPDGLALFGRTLRAGLPLSQAMQVASQELKGPVAEEFGAVFAELNYGGDLRGALMAMLERVPSVSVMALSTSIMIQRETGGNLAESVARLERLIRQRFAFQRKLRTLVAANKAAAWIVALLPFIMAGLLEFMSPGYVTDLFDDPTGQKMLAAALVLQAIGVLWIRKMIKLDI
ncbi:type II secretion system F family protein [Thiohalocapsa marina]|uniref:Type II secretion system F family protein n=1 Tax=Thiohalocapsa marina TaxID=424902 RepID=A0A5M8FS75_9GAMM|nr:type II secretion system F family protein [Thiohalocapsa marina]KAA6184702.1 type II secretion system F family protein [Thiohalocapsa marina]